MLALIFFLLLCGLIVGALGRLLVPGPNPIGILRTILVGIAGSFLGGLVGRLLFGWRYRYSGFLGFVLAVAFTALIVYLMDGRQRRAHPLHDGQEALHLALTINPEGDS